MDYKIGNSGLNYMPKINGNGMMSSGYNLKNYRQEYAGNTSAENLYNNLMRFVPRGSHMGNYKTEK